MHYNIKSILKSHGFDTELPYHNIYIKLFKALKSAIVSGKLNDRDKLPPSRLMAKDLSIARSTVLKAYDKLIGDGFAISTPGSGIYVAYNKMIGVNQNSTLKSIGVNKKSHLSKMGLKLEKKLKTTSPQEGKGVAFRPGLPPLDLFPILKWQTLSNNYWKKVKSSELSYSNVRGLRSLRKNIAVYLKIYRNIDCSPDQIVITSGSLHSLYLISTALIDHGDQVVIENPTYPDALKVIETLRAKIFHAPIDDEGIDLETFRHKKPKMVYTTPSNQYPLGIKMSMDRRMELRDWAQKKPSIIIEDDYDHEFSNWESPLPSIFSMDNNGRVVYLGTFNKLLYPSLRLGYMIVPDFLLNSVLGLLQYSTRFISPHIQNTLNAFIEKDYLNDHLRNLMHVVKRRHGIFTNYFDNHFDPCIRLEKKPSGLHVIGKLDKKINDKNLSDYLFNNGLLAHPLSEYYKKSKQANGLVMGYCSVNEITMNKKLNEMAQLVRNYKNNLPQNH